MKQLIKLLPLLIIFSCASNNGVPVYRDQYGVIHKRDVDPNEVSFVKVILSAHDLPGGCIRLRNIYLTGTSFKDWELKTETAKMNGSHLVKSYYNGLSDTMGIAYDCSKRRQLTTQAQWQKLRMRNAALSEIERRTYDKVKIVPVADTIPVMNYNSYK